MARDGVPPTVRERPSTTRGPGCGTVALLGLVMLALGALALWLLVFRAPARAARHVPSNANLVARLDLVELATFEPVRKHLGPVFEELAAARGAGGGEPGGAPGRDRVLEETGVDLRRDVREVVLASVDALSWVAVFGGHLARGRFVPGMQRLFAERGGAWRLDGDVLVGPTGAVVAQADDGSVVVATDLSLLRAALPATDDAAKLGLVERGVVSLAIAKPAFSHASDALGVLPHGGALAKIEAASGNFALGAEPALALRLEAVGGDAAALQKDLEPLLDEARVAGLVLPDLLGEKAALRGARLRVDGTAVVVDAPWPYDALDRACQRLAALARDARPPPPAP